MIEEANLGKSNRSSESALSFLEECLQSCGIVESELLRSKNEGRPGVLADHCTETSPRLGAFEFVSIPFPEFVPFCRLVLEPFPELMGRRDLPGPVVYLCLLLAQAARPKAVYKNSESIRFYGWLVDTFGCDRHRRLQLLLAKEEEARREKIPCSALSCRSLPGRP